MRGIYVAGASSEMERAEKWMSKLREAGIEVTSTWPDMIRHHQGVANPMDASHEERFRLAVTDLDQVTNSGALWLLLPETATTIGAWWEAAHMTALQAVEFMATGKSTRWVLSSGKERSIFTSLTSHFATDEEAFEAIVASFKEHVAKHAESLSAIEAPKTETATNP